MTPLDALSSPLAGINLIEASAGTGKTWTIAALYTRLLLEADAAGQVPGIEQLLVVTYTKAATAELRSRLRSRLHDLHAVLAGQATADPFLLAMAARHAGESARSIALARLNAAIVSFDTAAIYTIHGFCQRALTDAAFDSGQSFSAELIQDDSPLLQELVDDYWRLHIVGDPLLAEIVAGQGQTPEQWLSEIRPWLAKPYLTPDPVPAQDLVAAWQHVCAAWQALCEQRVAGEDALSLLTSAVGLNGRSHGPAQREKMQACLRRLWQSVHPPTPTADEYKLLEKMTPQALAGAANKNHSGPSHPFFTILADWLAAQQTYNRAAALQLAHLKLALMVWLDQQRVQRRLIERKRSFDDLLTDLYLALRDPLRGSALADRLAGSFRVALIDEFQDTDPTQYAIFATCFAERGRPLFLVGDPKQAIYSFRGADVHAYLDAARQIAPANRYTLHVNRRARPAVVAGINALFARPVPFVIAAIQYQPVDAVEDGEWLEINDDRASWNWQWLAAEDERGGSKREVESMAAEATVDEIARLLYLSASGQACLVSALQRRPLLGGDVAVLVNTHAQGVKIREALLQRRIASVTLTQESVYATAEAAALRTLLRAWARPNDERRFRLALATELYGWRAADLHAMLADEEQWTCLLSTHMEDYQRWATQGFMSAWRFFLVREQLACRLLTLPDGERRMTNLTHLTELLQKESGQQAGLLPLLDWYEQQTTQVDKGEDALLRLESDAALVKIATIHSAKGLQYPVVFCPFLWDGRLERKQMTFWRSRSATGARLTPDVIVDVHTRDQARQEILAEKLRLAYVALTRAQHRQYVAWGWASKMETSALFWLLHAPPAADLAALEAQDAQQIAQGLRAFVDLHAACSRIITDDTSPPVVAPAVAQHDYRAQVLHRTLYSPWRMASFSSLVQHASGHSERPDHDHGRSVATLTDSDAVADFPRGARAGTCLHAILEKIDFAHPQRALVAELVLQHGFAASHVDGALRLVQQTLSAELAPGVRLADIAPHRRLIELEFMLPMARLRPDLLAGILSDPAMGLDPVIRQAAGRLDFPRVSGYLKGFVDLVCEHRGQLYLVDYKSNDLGPTPAHYDQSALVRSIADEHYYLQYLLYCVALRRYCRARGQALALRFAGVRYLYMRGIDGTGMGIWQDQPSPALLDAIDQLFAG